MRISNCDKSSWMSSDLMIHLCHLIFGEFLRVKFEVLIVLGVQNVHPIYIYWESIILKVTILLHHWVCADLSIFREMEAKMGHRWHSGVSSDLRQIFKLGLWTIRSKHKKFELTWLTNEICKHTLVSCCNQLNPRVSWIHPQDWSIMFWWVWCYVWNRAILTTTVLRLVRKVVYVKEPVRISTSRVLQEEWALSFRQPIQMIRLECYSHAHSHLVINVLRVSLVIHTDMTILTRASFEV